MLKVKMKIIETLNPGFMFFSMRWLMELAVLDHFIAPRNLGDWNWASVFVKCRLFPVHLTFSIYHFRSPSYSLLVLLFLLVLELQFWNPETWEPVGRTLFSSLWTILDLESSHRGRNVAPNAWFPLPFRLWLILYCPGTDIYFTFCLAF